MLDSYAERRLKKLAANYSKTLRPFCKKPALYPAEADYMKNKHGEEFFFLTICFENEVKNYAVFN